MDQKPKAALVTAATNSIAQREWACHEKGLSKDLVDLKFTCMTKPTEISKCFVNISDVANLSDRETSYLNKSDNFWIQLGTAVTAIDYYTELFLQQMLTGETSRCSINTKSGTEIKFTITLLKIEFNNYIFKLSVAEAYNLALQLKENGVTMFKKYPVFAQEYFCRAAKILISYKPFDVLDVKRDGIESIKLKALLENIQTNIAACLVKESRYEDVLHVTEFVGHGGENVVDKAVYRRALAFTNMSRYEEAKELLGKHNHEKSKEFIELHRRVMTEWKASESRYSDMVKKMFG